MKAKFKVNAKSVKIVPEYKNMKNIMQEINFITKVVYVVHIIIKYFDSLMYLCSEIDFFY